MKKRHLKLHYKVEVQSNSTVRLQVRDNQYLEVNPFDLLEEVLSNHGDTEALKLFEMYRCEIENRIGLNGE